MVSSACAASTPSRTGCADAEEQADGQLPGALLHDHPKDSFRIRAQGHADAEFLGALAHGKNS